ncbi:contact-dependent growth inhibition system immunity protein [Nocardioides sp. GCM10027113]|uniref:contact-dependent growth inhibition system immunity protein n=1 Tax=unclassified Nocardioides TaxID=2615069 RepID=UPI003605B655
MTTPALEHLVGAYFHQDWADEFDDDPDRAVDAFVRDSPTVAPRLPREVDELLLKLSNEDSIHSHLASLGSHFTPAPEDGSYREWLASVANRVRAATS